LFLEYCSQTIGITDTSPGKNAFLTAVYCVIVPFLFWITEKSKPDIYNILVAFACITGIGLVSITSNFKIGMGDSLTLVGEFFYAAHIVAVAKFCKDKDPVLITILQFGYSAILSWIATTIFEPKISGISTDMIGNILYLAFGCTAAALLIQNFGKKYTAPSASSIILSL